MVDSLPLSGPIEWLVAVLLQEMGASSVTIEDEWGRVGLTNELFLVRVGLIGQSGGCLFTA